MGSEPAVVHGYVPVIVRMKRFFFRVCVALVLSAGLAYFIGQQALQVHQERILDFPLLVGLDRIDASIRATKLSATAVVRRGAVASMEELKVLAGRVAGRDAAGAELWSEVHPQYRAVYYQGIDSKGGLWIASARYLAVESGDGRVEVSFRRELIGRHDAIRHSLQGMHARLQSAAGRLLEEVDLQATIEARPPHSPDAQQLIALLMEGVGAQAIHRWSEGDDLLATGYSPRLTSSVHMNGSRTNVMIRLSQLGQGPWLEVGTPTL